MCSKDKNEKTHVYVQPFYLDEVKTEQLGYIVNLMKNDYTSLFRKKRTFQVSDQECQ